MFPASLSNAYHLSSDADAALVECLDGNFVAFSKLPQNVSPRNAAILEDQFASAGRPDAEFVLLFADRKSWKIAFNKECSNSFVTLVRTDVGEHDKKVCFDSVRDPQLPAIQNKMIAFIRRPARESKCVTAGARFRQRVSANHVFRESRKVLAFLVARCPSHNGIVYQRVLHIDEHAEGRVHTGNFLNCKNRHEKAARTAAEFFRNVNSHQAELEQFRNDALLELRFLVHLSDERADSRFGERPAR